MAPSLNPQRDRHEPRLRFRRSHLADDRYTQPSILRRSLSTPMGQISPDLKNSLHAQQSPRKVTLRAGRARTAVPSLALAIVATVKSHAQAWHGCRERNDVALVVTHIAVLCEQDTLYASHRPLAPVRSSGTPIGRKPDWGPPWRLRQGRLPALNNGQITAAIGRPLLRDGFLGSAGPLAKPRKSADQAVSIEAVISKQPAGFGRHYADVVHPQQPKLHRPGLGANQGRLEFVVAPRTAGIIATTEPQRRRSAPCALPLGPRGARRP